MMKMRVVTKTGGKACLLIRKHDHFTPMKEIKRHVSALARNHPEGWNLQKQGSRDDEYEGSDKNEAEGEHD